MYTRYAETQKPNSACLCGLYHMTNRQCIHNTFNITQQISDKKNIKSNLEWINLCHHIIFINNKIHTQYHYDDFRQSYENEKPKRFRYDND